MLRSGQKVQVVLFEVMLQLGCPDPVALRFDLSKEYKDVIAELAADGGIQHLD
jgi:hypothetical protein